MGDHEHDVVNAQIFIEHADAMPLEDDDAGQRNLRYGMGRTFSEACPHVRSLCLRVK